MSASLVGSEMCIRDSPTPNGPNGPLRGSESEKVGGPPTPLLHCRVQDGPVSYTHLTLPTICSV
eukprot:6735968-Alexandrium_andersonii.AAC.1